MLVTNILMKYEKIMPNLNHCIECDKPAQIINNEIYYCASCAMGNIEKEPTTADKFKEKCDDKRNKSKNI